ncbi:hypothetical protein CHS0354_039812 [Potamilus streckersoni]|uniref:SAM domain-containing protein n=1 Tax=Potamilus streckersoni TaxID=2493646 RepID=A0AAE0SRF0_9BIVA|nr:hypothetical protein CHS0354_039812 [Potamilus streckersoni]
MEFVVSHNDYSVSDFYTRYSSKFPVLAVVTQGWHGSILETTFNKGQILRLTSSITKKRVVGYPMSLDAVHSQECWSIPLDKDIRVVPVDNNLKTGKLDSKEIEVPLNLKGLRLMPITGLKHQSKEDFDVYCDGLDITPSLKAVRDRHRVVAVHNPEYVLLDADFLKTQPMSFHTIDEAFSIVNNKQNELLEATNDLKMQNAEKPPFLSSNCKENSYHPLQTVSETRTDRTIQNTSPPPIPPKCFKKEGIKSPSQQNDSKEISNRPLPELSIDQVSTDPNGTAILSKTKYSVYSYTIKEVEQTLKALRLEKHFKTFEKNMVDGRILSKLNEEILVREFGLSRTEAIRLMAFVREGHIPTV